MTSSPDDLNKALFLNLIAMLSTSAMQELGKLKNPLTGKTAVQLELAQATIDMLDMLEVKTRGNRDPDEDKVIKDTLTMLKMNYVETGSAAAAEAQRSEPQKSEISDRQTDKQTQPHVEIGGEKEKTANDAKPESKDPKFHKSYT